MAEAAAAADRNAEALLADEEAEQRAKERKANKKKKKKKGSGGGSGAGPSQEPEGEEAARQRLPARPRGVRWARVPSAA